MVANLGQLSFIRALRIAQGQERWPWAPLTVSIQASIFLRLHSGEVISLPYFKLHVAILTLHYNFFKNSVLPLLSDFGTQLPRNCTVLPPSWNVPFRYDSGNRIP